MASYRSRRIVDTTPNAPGTVAGTMITGIGALDSVIIFSTLQGATGGVLDVYLQSSFDLGQTWFDVVHFPQLAAGAPATTRVWPLSRHVIASPGLVSVGTGLNPALAANTAIGASAWGDRLRAVYVAGASTTAGAPVLIQVVGSTTLPWERSVDP